VVAGRAVIAFSHQENGGSLCPAVYRAVTLCAGMPGNPMHEELRQEELRQEELGSRTWLKNLAQELGSRTWQRAKVRASMPRK
jgi:hypothetical protein